MLLAAHSITAATTGAAIGNPLLAFLLGFIIHFALDAIPHFDTTDDGKFTFRQIAVIAIDGIFALTILLKMWSDAGNSGMFFGALGGVFPDIMLNIPLFKKFLIRFAAIKKLDRFHGRIQRFSLPPLPGVAVQVILVLASVYLFYRFVI